MYAQRVPLLADELPEQQSSHHSPLGDDAEADATRPQQALGTRVDGIEEGHWASLGRALPRHVRAEEARVHGRAFRALRVTVGGRLDACREVEAGLVEHLPPHELSDIGVG